MDFLQKGLKRVIDFQSLFNTIFLFCMVLILSITVLKINSHFINPFSNTLQGYELTDIAYSFFKNKMQLYKKDHEFVLVNIGGSPYRQSISNTLDTINKHYNPKLIGINVLLESEKDSLVDRALKQSILDCSKKCPVVLASKIKTKKKSVERLTNDWMELSGFPNISYGYINVIKPSHTIRSIQPFVKFQDSILWSFGAKVASCENDSSLIELIERNGHKENDKLKETINWNLDFEGNQSILNAESLSILSQSNVHKNKIFILGYMEKGSCIDKSFTPKNKEYIGDRMPDSFSPEIHAEAAHMYKSGLFIWELPTWLNCLITFLIVYWNVLLIRWVLFEKKQKFIFEVMQKFYIFFVGLILFFLQMLFLTEWNFNFNFSWCIISMVFAFESILLYEYLKGKYAKFTE